MQNNSEIYMKHSRLGGVESWGQVYCCCRTTLHVTTRILRWRQQQSVALKFSASPFAWPGTLGLLFVLETEVCSTREDTWKQQWRHSGCWRLLSDANFSFLFRRDRKTRISLANVYMYWCQEGICWKIHVAIDGNHERAKFIGYTLVHSAF